MPFFQKKPVVIVANRFDVDDLDGLSDLQLWIRLGGYKAELTRDDKDNITGMFIETLEDGPNGEAQHFASPGDYIIQGVKGEFYACKPDIFEETYQKVSDPQEDDLAV